MLCLELLFEVLSEEPCAILADLIHLMTKNHLMKARNDMVENVTCMLQDQYERVKERRIPLETVDG